MIRSGDQKRSGGPTQGIKQELAGLDVTRKALRDFGLLLCFVLGIGAGVQAWRLNPMWPWLAGAAGAVFLAGTVFPAALRPVYRAWMMLAIVLGWIMTRLILVVVYMVLMTPLGWLLRLFGKDLLDERITEESQSYWKKHEAVIDKGRYRKQF